MESMHPGPNESSHSCLDDAIDELAKALQVIALTSALVGPSLAHVGRKEDAAMLDRGVKWANAAMARLRVEVQELAPSVHLRRL
jgi:hypothetical protein